MAEHDPVKNGSVIHGSDGNIQGRKIAAIVCFVSGIGLLIHSVFQPSDIGLEARIGPAIVALTFALVFWGLLTIQNVFELLALLKGQPVNLPQLPASEAGEDLQNGEVPTRSGGPL
jgi:hypothetical protein